MISRNVTVFAELVILIGPLYLALILLSVGFGIISLIGLLHERHCKKRERAFELDTTLVEEEIKEYYTKPYKEE